MDAPLTNHHQIRRMTVAPPPKRRGQEPAAKAPAVTMNPEGPRRVVNVFVASLLLFVSSPGFIIIALLVKLTSKGPIFYTQTRVGLDSRGDRSGDRRRVRDIGGRPFKMFKFRTMQVDAEHGTGAVWATQDDPRVTVVGRFLRQFRLDELPQLINVLTGDMNLAGPRPERPAIFNQLRDQIPNYQLRQKARPGITGLAQISQKYDSTIEDVRRKVEYDLEYIQRASVWEDLKIMAKTIPVILFRRGGW